MSSERLAAWSPPRKSRLRVWIAAGLLAAYVVFVLVVTMTPNPVDQGFESSITRVLEILHRYGVPTWFGYNKLEFSANVAMFVPVGFLLGLAVPHRAWWLAVLAPVAFSSLIELTQLVLLPGRFATFTDILANSIGGWIGVLTAFALRGVVHARDRRVVARALWEQGH
jgi:glycopeptide antibiotics resistance protein